MAAPDSPFCCHSILWCSCSVWFTETVTRLHLYVIPFLHAILFFPSWQIVHLQSTIVPYLVVRLVLIASIILQTHFIEWNTSKLFKRLNSFPLPITWFGLTRSPLVDSDIFVESFGLKVLSISYSSLIHHHKICNPLPQLQLTLAGGC
jgi:hypothetical protein